MSEVTPEGLAAKIVAEIPKFFRDGIDQLLTGEGEYIRAGEPRGQVGQIGQAVARSYCRQYGADPGAARFGNAARIENACRPYLDDLDPGNGPELTLPFRGGQCPGEKYNIEITGTATLPSGAPNNWQLRYTARGPVGSLSFEVIEEPSVRFNIFQALGSARTFSSTCSPNPVINPGVYKINTTPAMGRPNGGDVSIIACGDDSCGNPPPGVRQPRPIPDPTGPRFPFNPSPDIDIDLGVEVLPDGTINVDIGTGPINVDPFPSGGDGSGGGDDEPGDVGDEDAEGAEDADEDGNASGCAGENQVLGGLKIAITTIPDTARFYAPGIVRGACYIYMGSEGNLDQDFGGSMLRDGQFFLPEKENLTCWEVQANLGFRLRVTPYYKTLEEE